MNNLNYITIEEHLQSKAFLLERVVANKNIDQSDWQNSLWNFLAKWLDESNDFIEVKTSGSTGIPKKILHNKQNMRNSATMTCQFFGLKKGDSAYCCLPITSIGGMMMVVRAIENGLKIIVAKPENNPLKNIDKEIDFMAMVPYQIANILEQSPEKLALVKNLIVGGGVLQPLHENMLLNLGVNAYHTFGMTETISHIALRKVGQKQFNTLPNITIESDVEGRLIINAPLLLLNPLLTNDLVSIKSANQFEWLGRYDNAIESGGVKVIPELIESKLEALIPHRFFIHSLPHSTLNNQLVLVVEASDFTINKELFAQHLSKYEIPKQIFCVEKFEETESGKIMRANTMKLI